ncbi:Holliday junction branch migration protein RuvA [Corynebacterium confusum]|uniref:Holliday junction branch migration protein RuvA n=1 Tax=Corynebacterium confusum TaxID=71254 RepID=UPI0025B45C35|nr:Holliday junction branch migration protein RuvA [Corynebacterium confusum]WJY89861.1 Holliday junction ATP-dependent DNA helicase RuvA [Corynebacterium confusum]
MIASLRGEVISIALDHAVIECQGVGYLVHAAPPTLGRLTRGEEAFVLTSMVVKEDSMTLYGFGTAEDREMFHLLQSVSGLGPKLALAALSVLEANELAQAISQSDAKRLQTIPGVGKRMAERLALELKDKVAGFAGAGAAADEGAAAGGVPAASEPVVQQVTEALMGLGFTEKAAAGAVEAIVAEQPDAATPVVLRNALARLGKK